RLENVIPSRSFACQPGYQSCPREMPATFRDRLPCATSNRRPFVLPPRSEKFARRLIPPFLSQSRRRLRRLGRTPDISLAPRRYARKDDNSAVTSNDGR